MTEPFGPPAIDVVRVSDTGSFRAPDAGDEAAQTARLLAELEAPSSPPAPRPWR